MAFFVPHLGCLQRCSFCDQSAITGSVRVPDGEEVWETAVRAAEALQEKTAGSQIAFFGGSFTAVPRSTMLSLLEPAARAVEELGFAGIRCSTRPDAVDEECLGLLKRYRVTAIELGAQSMCDEVLRLNRRGHTAAQTESAARLIKAMGFELGLQMMTGLYGDTDERALETAEKLISLNPQTARIYPTVVLEGTYLAKLNREGVYRPQTLEEAVGLCAKLLTKFESAGVRVIRLGLHAQTQVEEKKLCGPYHPAFRELVESRIFREKLVSALSSGGKGTYCVKVHPKSLSVALGQKKENLGYLRKLGYEVEFSPSREVPRGSFSGEKFPFGSLCDILSPT